MHEKLLLGVRLLGVPARARTLWLRPNHRRDHQQLLQMLRSHRVSKSLILRLGRCCWAGEMLGRGTVCPVAVK